MKGKNRSEETKQKISKSHIGLKPSKETKIKQSIKAKNRIKIKCIYCNKELVPNIYKRWHGNNCKNYIISSIITNLFKNSLGKEDLC